MAQVQKTAKVYEIARGDRMILDSGTCKLYRITNTAGAGKMPNSTLVLTAECWFGELGFESTPTQHTETLEQIEISRRIRILQNRTLENKTVVVIGTDQYKVERLYHGTDSDSGELITDISLSKVVSAYAVS